MEVELSCSLCCQLLSEPLLLPCCCRAICSSCAKTPPQEEDVASDKASVYSETDSGVVVAPSIKSSTSGLSNHIINGGSIPPSSVSPPTESTGHPFSNHILTGGGVGTVRCPSCRKSLFLGPSGLSALPPYPGMDRIVTRYKSGGMSAPGASTNTHLCQLCEESRKEATTHCLQCKVFYCNQCLSSCHPMRGPLSTHTLNPVGTSLQQTQTMTPQPITNPSKCLPHGETGAMYCIMCRCVACEICVLSSHAKHDLQPMEQYSKTQKTELSSGLQQLSSRAKAAHGHITQLKTMQDRVTSHCDSLAAALERQCDELAEAVEAARQRLHCQLQAQREATAHTYRDSASSCTRKLQQTTALVQFCIEAIKEPDSAAFLQMGPHLTGRVSDLDLSWDKELTSHPASELSPYLPLDLDHHQVIRAIQAFNFITMKPAKDGEERVPAVCSAPQFILGECGGDSDRLTVEWTPHPTSRADDFILEMDGGTGKYAEVHRGPETICSVEGLQFNTVYTLRVKAINKSGDSPFSIPVSIRTAPGAWFPLTRSLSHPDCNISDQGLTVTCDSYEHRVASSNIGFSRGRHYWQFRIDSYDANADVAFGVASKDVNREVMLGNDEHGWAMYVDHQRSWFLHSSTHHGRSEGGLRGVGALVGILLEWKQQKAVLSFYINYEQQGEYAFTDLEGPLYPAVSVNRNVTVSLHTSLDAPSRLTRGMPKVRSTLDTSAIDSANILSQNLQSIHLTNAHGHSDYDSQSDT